MLDLVSFPGDGNYLTFFCVQHHRPFLSPFSNPIQILLKIVLGLSMSLDYDDDDYCLSFFLCGIVIKMH